MCPRSIAGVPSNQAFPAYLITAPPSVGVPDVIGALTCGFQTKKKKRLRNPRKREERTTWTDDCTTSYKPEFSVSVKKMGKR